MVPWATAKVSEQDGEWIQNERNIYEVWWLPRYGKVSPDTKRNDLSRKNPHNSLSQRHDMQAE
jgi:hypothetical protein